MKHIKSHKEFKEFKEAKKLNENVDEFISVSNEVTEEQFIKMIDVFRDKDMMINDEVLLKKAREDQFKGDLKPVRSKKSGQIILIYRPSINIGSKMTTESNGYSYERAIKDYTSELETLKKMKNDGDVSVDKVTWDFFGKYEDLDRDMVDIDIVINDVEDVLNKLKNKEIDPEEVNY